MTEYPTTICKKKDCNLEFRYNPNYSTIKPKHCPRCQKLIDFEKRREYNQKLLAQATFNNTSKQTKFSTSKYPIKQKSGKKRIKSGKSLAMANADKWFSIYIRIKYAYKIQNGEVFCQCIVNPNIIKLAQRMDNGHGFSRQFKTTRYYEDNCRPQNRSSNRFSGEADHYTFLDNLKKEIGEERFQKLDELRRTEGEDNEMFYKEQSDKYRKLVNELVFKHQIKKWW